MAVQLVVDEFGIRLVLGVSFDMSANTDLEFTFIKPDCTTTLIVPGVLGTTVINTDQGTFAANEWAYYSFVTGDLDQPSDTVNKWRVELRYQGPNGPDPVAQLYSVPVAFDVSQRLLAGTP